jgi:hypothetical protein
VGINAAVGLTLLLLVAVLALVVNPPAPPGIAAFAPQANKPITKAPLSQSAQFGEGDGSCAAGQVCGSAATTTSTTIKGKPRGVPSSLQCYEWPDGSVTQTFDPQSPPCVATWDDTKGNGGATSPGVTKSEIRVALPVADETNTHWPGLQPIVDFFNTRFQFYGRKITIVPVLSQQSTSQSTGDYDNPEMQKADATQIVSQKVFAAHDFVDPIHYSWSLPVYRDTLTRAKVISIHGGETTPNGSAADLLAHLPYEWTYYAPMDVVMRNLATLTCRQLVGKPASHASEASLQTKTRKFAAIFPTDGQLGGPMPGLSVLQQTLANCGVSFKVVRYDLSDRGSDASTAAALRELQADGVTSIFWFPFTGGGTARHPWFVANSIGYQPEWLLIGWNKYEADFEIQNPRPETAGAFGVGVWNKMAQLPLEFWYRAYVAAGGTNGASLLDGRAFYQELMLLASGIQMAGPHLTPESFARGLQSTKFPNPGAGGPPFYQGAVGFGSGDTTMVNDMQAFWYDPNMVGQEVVSDATNGLNTSRATCYVASGRRWFLDTWPAADGFFEKGVCR